MFRNALKAFFEIKEQEAIISKEGGKKITITAVGRFFYGLLDYLIATGLGVMVVALNAKNFSGIEIFIATWIYDTLASALFYGLSEKTGVDITLGKSFRRAADVMFKNGIIGRFLGGLLLLGVSVKAILWEGPEVICFIFKKEIGSPFRIALALIILSALQAIFGAWLYTTGYETLKAFLPADVKFWQIVLMAIAIFVSFTVVATAIVKLAQWSVAVARSFWESSQKEKLFVVISLLVMIAIIFYIVNDLVAKGVI